MRALSRTFRVTGRNRNLFFSSLKKRGVNLLKIKIINEKTMEITIDNKDTDKYFAILKNMWYNEQVKTGGLWAPLVFLKKNAARAVACVCFVIFLFFSDNLYFAIDYEGDSSAFKTRVEAALTDAGVEKFKFFSDGDLKNAQKSLDGQNAGFISLSKKGSRIVVDLRENKSAPEMIVPLQKDCVAEENFKILKIVVYSGTQMFYAGDEVKKGDVLVGAYDDSSGERKFRPVLAAISGECSFTFVYESPFEVTDETKNLAIAAAKNALGDKKVFSCECSTDGKKISVIIKYEKNVL